MASERKWWLCLIRFLKLSYALDIQWKSLSQYAPNFFWKQWTCKNCYWCFASAVMNMWSYVWFYLSQNFKRNASFHTGSTSAPEKQAVNLLITLEFEIFKQEPIIKQKANLLIVEYSFLRFFCKYFTVLGAILLGFLWEFGWIFQKHDNNRQKIDFYDSDLCRFGAI